MASEIREATFMVLSALAGGPAHGYAIMHQVEELTGGDVTLKASTLYAALDRLGADQLVEVLNESIVQGRLRRTYQLTDSGSRRVVTEARRRRDLAQQTLTRLGMAMVAAS
jgi:DNA-binding PadR family transcriptional regulator